MRRNFSLYERRAGYYELYPNYNFIPKVRNFNQYNIIDQYINESPRTNDNRRPKSPSHPKRSSQSPRKARTITTATSRRRCHIENIIDVKLKKMPFRRLNFLFSRFEQFFKHLPQEPRSPCSTLVQIFTSDNSNQPTLDCETGVMLEWPYWSGYN